MLDIHLLNQLGTWNAHKDYTDKSKSHKKLLSQIAWFLSWLDLVKVISVLSNQEANNIYKYSLGITFPATKK